jgi:outer membrane lipoprotein carrier protein
MIERKKTDCPVAWFLTVLFIGIFATASSGFSLSLEEIIKGVETRYSGLGFSARFYQTSTLKAMEITESASGMLIVRKPGMMRWEYEDPDRQLVVTDGTKLWIYRPDDNQVMIGKAPSFFGDGKGAGFLSDIERVRQNFTISLDGLTENSQYRLKLLPQKKTFDIATIYLVVAPNTFDVVEIVTLNDYEDETRIRFSDIQHRAELETALFNFKIPKDADILKMDE